MPSNPKSEVRNPKSISVARLYGPRDIRVEEMEPPGQPRPQEVLVRLKAVGVCGSDVHYFKSGRIGSAVVTEPLIMGHEPGGIVEAVGEGVTHVRVGDCVAVDPAISCGTCESCVRGHPNLCPHVRFFGTPPVDGVYRELVLHPAHAVFPLPAGMTCEEGALLETLGIGLHAVDLSHLRPGETAAVLGVGPVGLMTLAAARVAGASRLFASDLLEPRLAMARTYGADVTLRADEADVVEAILEATSGRGVDVAFEAAGAAETPQQCAEAVKPGGTVVLIGIPEDDQLRFQHGTVRRKGLTIKICRRMKHTYPRAIALVSGGQINVARLVTHRFPLERLAEALELVAGYRDGVVKAMIEL